MNLYSVKRALLANSIDYAGTFPPAALSLENAIKEAATCRRSLHHPWLYAKMALPLAQIKKLIPKVLCADEVWGVPWLFTALSSEIPDTVTAGELAQTVDWDIREAIRFNDRFSESSSRQKIVAYEFRLPLSVVEDASPEAIRSLVHSALDRLGTGSAGQIIPFIEIPWTERWKSSIESVADAVSLWGEDNVGLLPAVGLKFRTGGKFTPSAEQLAHAVQTCALRRLRFKATQGLHSALTDSKGLGFLNLFTSIHLTYALGIGTFSASAACLCLESKNEKEFVFSENSFSWREYTLELEKIELARRYHGACFGSCSIVEPDESLHKLFPG